MYVQLNKNRVSLIPDQFGEQICELVRMSRVLLTILLGFSLYVVLCTQKPVLFSL